MRKHLLPILLIGLVTLSFASESGVNYQGIISNAKIVMETPEAFISDELRNSLTSAEIPEEAIKEARAVQVKTKKDLNEKLRNFEFMGAKVDQSVIGESGPLEPGEQVPELLRVGERTHIAFISMSIPDDQLKQIFHAMSRVDRAFAVMVGFMDSAPTIGANILALRQKLTELEISPPPDIFIEFELFDSAGIQSVPVFAIYDGLDLVSSVSGLPNFNWLAEQVDERGVTGNLGVKGPTFPIQEQHFMEMIAERLEQIDFEAQTKAAVDNYWNRRGNEFSYLPIAKHTESFLVDMTVTVTSDITAADGTVIARAGDSFNPLDQVPFNRLGIVFDASKKDQLEWAIEKEQAAFDRGLIPIVLVTAVSTTGNSWDNFAEVQNRFVTSVARLDSAIKARFQIEAVPTLFEAVGGDMKITEVAISND